MNKLFSKRTTAVLVAAAMLVTLPLAGCNNSKKDENVNSKGETASSGQQNGDDIVVKSKNYSIKYDVIQYLANYMVSDFCSTYGTSYFDTGKDLKKQYYNQDEGISWYDYFYERVKNYVTQIMVFAEGGKENGLKLSDDELKQLETNFNTMESVAAESSMTLDEFIADQYGSNITKKEVEDIQKMTVLAMDYSNYLHESFKYTDEEYEKQFKENKNNYVVADYLVYSFAYSDEETSGAVKKEVAKESADALANAKNKDEFNEYLEKYLRDNPLNVSVPTSSEASVTEEDFNAGVEAALEAAENTKVAYSDANNCYKWIFSDDRKENDITVIDENSAYNVILVTKPVYRDETETRNIRHILIQAEEGKDASDEELKKKAEEIYQEWKDGDKTEQTFGELANKYSSDPGSNTNGGLYENVEEGYMVEEFNDWMFDPSRKVGDNGIVKTDIGYHIMYYPGPGLKSWQVGVDSDLRANDVSEEYENLKEKYSVQFDEDLLENLEIKLPESVTSTASTGSSQTVSS